jgi:hypothetical protein
MEHRYLKPEMSAKSRRGQIRRFGGRGFVSSQGIASSAAASRRLNCGMEEAAVGGMIVTLGGWPL